MANRIKSSITLKIFLSIATILIVSSLLIYLAVMTVMPKSYQVREGERVITEAEQLITQLQTVSRTEAGSLIERFCLRNKTTAVLQSDHEKEQFGALEEPAQNIEGNTSTVQTLSFVVMFPDSATSYLLLISQPVQTVSAISATFYRLFPWILLLILAVSAVGAWILSRLISKPVLEICMISKRMSEMDLTWRCDSGRTDELGALAASLNEMAGKLSFNMEELKAANRQLKTDMIRQQEEEQRQRIFYAAVSHELKTPITILKGQLESMIMGIGDYKNRDKYLPSSLDTVNRMEGLVKEILMISRLTRDGMSLKYSSVNLQEVILDVLPSYELLASEKNIRILTSEIQETYAEVERNSLKKVVSNLLSNAIAYSPPEALIRVTLAKGMLSVENTRVWIPEHCIPELFTPFYRIEQSRNKNTGGSGLGLYIVKTILDLHKMPFSITNTAEGVRFTIALPAQGTDIPYLKSKSKLNQT